jgi:hypothetical protein
MQTPATHSSPSCWQFRQDRPPVPQIGSVFPGWQRLAPSQQPFGQLSSSQTQRPLALHRCPGWQAGTHAAHWPFWHDSWPLQPTQDWPPAPQFWAEFPGWQTPSSSQQPLGQFCGRQLPTHRPLSLHVRPVEQVPQEPPQPSGPQVRPVQLGTQQSPSALHSVAPALQQTPSQQCTAHWPVGSGPSTTVA